MGVVGTQTWMCRSEAYKEQRHRGQCQVPKWVQASEVSLWQWSGQHTENQCLSSNTIYCDTKIFPERQRNTLSHVIKRDSVSNLQRDAEKEQNSRKEKGTILSKYVVPSVGWKWVLNRDSDPGENPRKEPKNSMALPHFCQLFLLFYMELVIQLSLGGSDPIKTM